MNDQFGQLTSAMKRQLSASASGESMVFEQGAPPDCDLELRTIFERALEAMVIFNDDGNCVAANPAACTLFGLSKEELIGKALEESMDSGCDWRERLSTLLATGRATGEVKIDPGDRGYNSWREVEYSATANIVSGLHLATLHDITDRKRAEEQLQYHAFYDSLTGLPNRTWLLNCLGRCLRKAKRRSGYVVGLLFIHLERFEIIKYSFGHLVGDRLLRAIAFRLGTCLQPTDTLARVGTDEFAILLEAINELDDAIAVADRIHQELTMPFQVNGHEMFASANIGIAMSPRLAQETELEKMRSPNGKSFTIEESNEETSKLEHPEDLLRAADTAMYHAKVMGGGRTAAFEPAMHLVALASLQLENDLRRALKGQELLLYYQPIIDLSLGRLVGFEALVRWQHPKRGLVSPGEFIPIAETTGLIVPMGAWILYEACRQLREWQVSLLADRSSEIAEVYSDLSISVNLAGVQLAHPGLVELLDQVLDDTGLEGRYLKLEITETAIASAPESVRGMLLQLKQRQIQLCIDDFGTGYSSLSRLHRLPIDTLKIDRSFVINMSDQEGSMEIVRTILSLARNLGMDAIAEGIETAEQLAQLRKLGSEYGQGYYFRRPLDAASAAALLVSQPQW